MSARRRQRDHPPAVFHALVAQRRLERRRGPFLRVERLAVVVRVEADRSSRARRADFAEHNRIAAGDGHQLAAMPRFSIMAAMASALRWMFCAIAGDVRDRKQGDELVDDGSFVLLAPGAGSLRRRVRLGDGNCGQED